MAYWLVKSEPETWSWQDQVKNTVSQWDGVRNYQAASYLNQMRLGDHVFFYHSVSEKKIVGIVEVVREAYPDPTDEKGRFVAVDLRAMQELPHPISLEQIKKDPQLCNLPLVRQSRLSVMPIDMESWHHLCRLGGIT